ncbi:hypothetical protein [Peterkaempfera griseoplana]|uniref:hypothetical protein n=1 Tax=Peterkaempfera griseoplana TaxID=66896 RepID=UPI0006E18846|nr:hypothetical protein [Peterkaempfera griseoplana]
MRLAGATDGSPCRRARGIPAGEGPPGDQFWLLTSRVDDGSFYPEYDGYRITWNNDQANPVRSTAKLLSDHARAMAAGTGS